MLTERSYSASLSAMLGICLVIMLIAIDSTVVGTALPRIVAELQGYALYPWIASAYLMTNAVMIPIAGRLGDLYGRKIFVLAAIVIFTLASALCGMAETMLQLVLARGLQGVGGGILTGVAFAAVSDLFPDRLQRVRWQAMLSATFGISTAVGPVLGGWLTEHLSWRSVFYVNLPVAMLAFPVISRYLPRIVHHDSSERTIDWLGALLLAVGICTLLVATEQGQRHGLLSPWCQGLFALAAVTAALFVWHQHHSAAPIIPARLFANRGVRQLSTLGALAGLTLFAVGFYSPLLLQGGFGLSPHQAGVMVTPLLVFVTIGSIINGRLLGRVRRPERLISWGLGLLIVACVLLSFLDTNTPRGWNMAVFALCGLSFGFQLSNLTLQIQAVVDRHDIGIASALIQMTRMLGSMAGASVAGTVVNLTFSRQVAATLSAQNIAQPELVQLLATPQILVRAADQDSLLQLARTLGFDQASLLAQVRVGLVDGIDHVYLGCALVAALSLLLSLRLPPFVLHQPARDDTPAADVT